MSCKYKDAYSGSNGFGFEVSRRLYSKLPLGFAKQGQRFGNLVFINDLYSEQISRVRSQFFDGEGPFGNQI